jgi:hypothetical protein
VKKKKEWLSLQVGCLVGEEEEGACRDKERVHAV